MVFYSYSKTLYDGRVVKITYIYWMGMIYEKLPLRTVLYNDMILQLFNHLHDSMPSVPSDDLTSDKEGLITLLSRCESVNFKSAFKYDFKGNSTNPSDNNCDEVYGVAVFGEFEEVSESIISQWTKEEIFKDNTFSFFNSVPAIKTKLDQQIAFWLTQNGGTTQDNNWGHEKFAKLYGHPSDSSKELHTRVFVSYANASLRGMGQKGTQTFFTIWGDSDGV
ncbi:hypothetical protein CPB84DRAFT_1782928 [Gymnopilus junonius]|uniref:Uncharacterized protein n=1 Tax=Gymnopilus junonius TaxID=109634 RepID=A0A9P5NMK3_GYMJU|nr:hypothetical protein CPB84DRAFT_1782928 [Gymnopilus junonius]